MLKESLAKYLSDTIKSEPAINDRFPWVYLRDLYQLLVLELTLTQQQLEDDEIKILIERIVKVISLHPLSFKDYFHVDESHRRELLKHHLRQYVTPMIMTEMRNKAKKSEPLPSSGRRNLFKRIFGLA